MENDARNRTKEQVRGMVVSIMKLDTISLGHIIVVNKERESDCVQYHGADLIATLKTLLACENIFGWLLARSPALPAW